MFFCFNHSLLEQVGCLEPLSCCVRHFLLRSNFWINTLTVFCRICLYNSEFNCAGSSQNLLLVIQAKRFSSSVHSNSILPISFWLIHMALSKPRTGSSVVFGEKWLPPCISLHTLINACLFVKTGESVAKCLWKGRSYRGRVRPVLSMSPEQLEHTFFCAASL